MASFNSDDLQFSDPEVESPLRNPRLGKMVTLGETDS